MTSSIVEVPIVADSSPGEAVEGNAPEPAVLPTPKKRGRPKGAPNKPKQPTPIQEVPVAPAPEKKKRAAKPPPSESDEEPPAPKPSRKRARPRAPSSSDDEPAPPKKRTTKQPEPPNTQQLAAEVLQLLSSRHVGQANARRARYASWFA